MSSRPQYSDFLGEWILVPECSKFEQGDAPSAGSYRIEEVGDKLVFHMGWTDAKGEEHQYSFSGTPDGEQHPFAGGELADSISVTAISETELNSAAYFAGRELMLATRTLVEGGLYLDVRQVVRLPDHSEPCNFSRYRRLIH